MRIHDVEAMFKPHQVLTNPTACDATATTIVSRGLETDTSKLTEAWMAQLLHDRDTAQDVTLFRPRKRMLLATQVCVSPSRMMHPANIDRADVIHT